MLSTGVRYFISKEVEKFCFVVAVTKETLPICRRFVVLGNPSSNSVASFSSRLGFQAWLSVDVKHNVGSAVL